MVRGYYTAASGAVTQQKKLNSLSNNIANVSTVGYKKDGLVAGTFGEHIAVRMNAYQSRPTIEIGKGVFMQTVVDEYTDYTQGGFEDTGRPMDLAISGNGFFVIADAEGNEYLTRDGQFSLDEEGYLVYPGFGRVQGDSGDIQISTSEFYVDRSGNIITFDEEDEVNVTGRLSIAIPANVDDMVKSETGMFTSPDYAIAESEAEGFIVRQGKLERSNVNIAEEMSQMISSQRAFQSCSQIVKMYDDLSDQMNTRISRVQP